MPVLGRGVGRRRYRSGAECMDFRHVDAAVEGAGAGTHVAEAALACHPELTSRPERGVARGRRLCLLFCASLHLDLCAPNDASEQDESCTCARENFVFGLFGF